MRKSARPNKTTAHNETTRGCSLLTGGLLSSPVSCQPSPLFPEAAWCQCHRRFHGAVRSAVYRKAHRLRACCHRFHLYGWGRALPVLRFLLRRPPFCHPSFSLSPLAACQIVFSPISSADGRVPCPVSARFISALAHTHAPHALARSLALTLPPGIFAAAIGSPEKHTPPPSSLLQAASAATQHALPLRSPCFPGCPLQHARPASSEHRKWRGRVSATDTLSPAGYCSPGACRTDAPTHPNSQKMALYCTSLQFLLSKIHLILPNHNS